MSSPADLLTSLGAPGGAIGIAFLLVQGAKALEKDASRNALEYVSRLLTQGNLHNMGKVSVTLAPLIFDKIFGSKPFSYKFISRSIIATSVFWILLLLLKHAKFSNLSSQMSDLRTLFFLLIPFWYILDWMSLVKSKYLLSIVSEKFAIVSSLLFFILDISLSYILACACYQLVNYILDFIPIPISFILDYIMVEKDLVDYMKLEPITSYWSSNNPSLYDVVIPSTLFTSIWTFLLFISGIITQCLAPIDYIRRFATFWFKDVERHPLTVTAKVAATLIILGAVVTKVVQWV